MTHDPKEPVISRQEAIYVEVDGEMVEIREDDTTGCGLEACVTIYGKHNFDRFIAALVKAREEMQ